MEPLKIGQVWREYRDKDYGHIIRWEVTLIKGKTAIVRNMATTEERFVYGKGQLDTFTFQCELMQDEKGWNP